MKRCEQHLINAFGGRKARHMRYLFANQAEKEKFTNSSLFEQSHTEYVHTGVLQGMKHLNGGFVANSMGAFGPGDTLKNLQLAIDGETFEIEEMYPVYIEVAKFQGEKLAQRSFEWSYATEKLHKQLFEKAFDAVNAGKDVKLGPVQICEVCGYTLEGEAPDRCPVCGAVKEVYCV